MGVHGQITCPNCVFTTWQRLGVGEEGLWGTYQEHAQRELAAECPDHPKQSSPWRFLATREWEAVEARYYGHGVPRHARAAPAVVDPATGLATCSTCKGEYDPKDAAVLDRHTLRLTCGCSRCSGEPACYMCGSSFCFCMSH